MNHSPRNYPVTIGVSLLAILVHLISSSQSALELDFSLVSRGQWWRILTGHLTHFDAQHLFWDLLMFAGLAAACERMRPRQIALVLPLMAAGISLAVRLFCPEISLYRGLSGIDTGLFVWFAGMRIQRAVDDGNRVGIAIWSAPCVGLIGKLIYESTTCQTLFVDSAQFTPLVEAHLAGVVIGILICLYGRSVNFTDVRYRLPSR